MRENQNHQNQDELPGLSELQRLHVNSRPNRFNTMAIGESMSESIRFPLDSTRSEDITTAVSVLRSSVSKARSTAALRSGFTFELNTGSFITDKHDIIYSVVVTRVE